VIYDALSEERKRLQDAGDAPSWWTTGGYQLFKERYQWAETPRIQYETIAKTLSKHTDNPEGWEALFFEMMWKGWLSPSTPVLSNTGTNRGLPVSCSGGVTEDSIEGFYTSRRESAILTKHGFGTSSYLGNIRPRGAEIKSGGKADGVLPVLKGFVQDSRDVRQGSARRGAWAGYIPIDHGDFWEVTRFLEKEPDDVNVGWVVTDAFIDRLKKGDQEAISRYQETLKVKMVTGKGYFWFVDKANRKIPKYYPIENKASNLCSEILLPSDENHTFTCVLSSLNLAKYDEWKDTDTIFNATVFLDCVVSEFIEKAKGVPGLENAVRFTQKSRALGLGVCGWHTFLQQRMIAFESLEAHMWNSLIFKEIHDKSLQASKWMGREWGCPEWGNGEVRNCSRIAVAPTKSTALIMGGVSEGINPDPAMVFTQATAGGEVSRVNPVLLDLMKKKGVYNKKNVQEVNEAFGSVQDVDWLTDDEKKVFRTAFEIDQSVVIRQAASRGKYIDQWQSLNLFFGGTEDPAYVSKVHQEAFLDEGIVGLYYVYSRSEAKGSIDRGECLACQ
jgi:ribonucleoside-diphosphate reductase alpha chain